MENQESIEFKRTHWNRKKYSGYMKIVFNIIVIAFVISLTLLYTLSRDKDTSTKHDYDVTKRTKRSLEELDNAKAEENKQDQTGGNRDSIAVFRYTKDRTHKRHKSHFKFGKKKKDISINKKNFKKKKNSIHGTMNELTKDISNNMELQEYVDGDNSNGDNRSQNSNGNKNSGDYEDDDDDDDNDDNDNSDDNDDDYSEEKRAEYHALLRDQIFSENIERNLIYLSQNPHLAGTEENNVLAEWIKKKFKCFKFDNVMEKKYNVLLSFPTGPGNLTLFYKNGTVQETISIVEKELDWFEKNGTLHYLPPPFLAYSPAADVEGEMIYANFGEEEDFWKLQSMNIDLNGKIVLIRYGAISRNKKIKYAEQYNVSGVILFSDPDTYSPTGVFYPDSWYLPPDGVQRGTLLRMRGDPLSRGYPAIDGYFQRPIEEVTYFPKVPVQPLGFGDAEKLLSTLDGVSPPNDKWHGKLNITYNITSKDGRKVRLNVNVTREKKDITNVIGIIRGAVEPDRVVILGNHRDAWTYGAADPSSGTAVMVEMARALGWLKEKGWRPRRTILIASFDAEEYGLLGSTEWTEEFAKILTHQAVAYINVDTAVQGNHTIELKSTPELVDVFFEVARLFTDPDKNDKNLYEEWVRKHEQDEQDKRTEPRVRMFREGSDYMPFYADLGIASMDFRYTFNTKDHGVFNYPVYHTIHDNIAWMCKFVDSDFRYHATIAKIWTQVALLLADKEILPYNFLRYSDSLKYRVRDMKKLAEDNGVESECDFSLLMDTVDLLSNVTREFHERVKDMDKTNTLAVRIVNDQMMMFERTFVTSEALPGEPSTRHVYHTAGLSKALSAVIRKKDDPDFPNVQEMYEFKTKYSTYTYHLNMAVHSLKNPFTNVDDDTDITEKSDKKKDKKNKSKKNSEYMSKFMNSQYFTDIPEL